VNCECTKFLHEPGKPPCENEAHQPNGVVSSPALCIRCLYYCWNDEEA
jgi:hypothetical protein